MHPFTEEFHHCGSLLASPESLTIIAMRSTPAGPNEPCQKGVAVGSAEREASCSKVSAV